MGYALLLQSNIMSLEVRSLTYTFLQTLWGWLICMNQIFSHKPTHWTPPLACKLNKHTWIQPKVNERGFNYNTKLRKEKKKKKKKKEEKKRVGNLSKQRSDTVRANLSLPKLTAGTVRRRRRREWRGPPNESRGSAQFNNSGDKPTHQRPCHQNFFFTINP